jgi:hypothetical protein
VPTRFRSTRRTSSSISKRWALVLLALVVLEFAVALFPFRFEPRSFTNDVHYADGVLVTGAENRATTVGPAAWTASAIATGRFRIDLEVRSASVDQNGPARILTVSESFERNDVTIAQDGADLVVLLRRPGSYQSGEPRFVVGDVFGNRGWRTVQVDVDGEIQIAVDGVTRLREHLPAGGLSTWDPAYPLSVGDGLEEGRAWAGEIRRAAVGTAAVTVDYARPGALDVPAEIANDNEREWQPSRPGSAADIGVGVLHLLLFVPIGIGLRMVLRRRPLPLVVVLFVACGLATAIQFTKTLFDERHPAVVDILWFGGGALLGAWVTARVVQRMREADALDRWMRCGRDRTDDRW